MILMASLDHRKNPLNLELKNDRLVSFDTAYFCCFKGGLEDKILVPKPPQNCATCGDPVDGLYCRPCAFVRKCLNEGWYIIHDGNTSESSNDNTNIILSDSNDDDTSSDDNDFEGIEYVSLEEVNKTKKRKNVILREKLLNISRLFTNIESLKDNPTPDHVLKSPSSFSIPIVDSDSFFEESDTFFSYLDNSLPEFETFSDHTEETRSGSTTTHANNSLPEFESFHFYLYDDSSFPRPPSEPPDVEISLIIETDAPVINNFDELNEDECFIPGGGEINVEVDNFFTFVTRIFLPYLTYPEDLPNFFEDSRVRCFIPVRLEILPLLAIGWGIRI
ncbi:hypothetical protein Tco_0410382 [Tanacetum coccineum]